MYGSNPFLATRTDKPASKTLSPRSQMGALMRMIIQPESITLHVFRSLCSLRSLKNQIDRFHLSHRLLFTDKL